VGFNSAFKGLIATIYLVLYLKRASLTGQITFIFIREVLNNDSVRLKVTEAKNRFSSEHYVYLCTAEASGHRLILPVDKSLFPG
jgi:hypothetical protein